MSRSCAISRSILHVGVRRSRFCGSLWGSFSSATWGSLYTLKKPSSSVFMNKTDMHIHSTLCRGYLQYTETNQLIHGAKKVIQVLTPSVSLSIQTCIHVGSEANLTRVGCTKYSKIWMGKVMKTKINTCLLLTAHHFQCYSLSCILWLSFCSHCT